MDSILVIEDEENVRENLVEFLESEGYRVMSAPDGEVGIQLARRELPDLIICDILMPRVDGFGVLARLSRDEVTTSIPFLFLTALSIEAKRRLAMGLGADDYITKPFSLDDLSNAVRTRLEKHRRMINLARQKEAEIQDRVVASIPYEILTPLSLIMSHAETLSAQEKDLPRAQANQIGRTMNIAATRLVRWIQNYFIIQDLEKSHYDSQQIQFTGSSSFSIVPEELAVITNQIAQEYERRDKCLISIEPSRLRVEEIYFVHMFEELVDFALSISSSETPFQLTGRLEPATRMYDFELVFAWDGRQAEEVRFLKNENPLDMFTHGYRSNSIGLLVIRQVVAVYGGTLALFDDPDQSFRLVVSLPLEAEEE